MKKIFALVMIFMLSFGSVYAMPMVDQPLSEDEKKAVEELKEKIEIGGQAADQAVESIQKLSRLKEVLKDPKIEFSKAMVDRLREGLRSETDAAIANEIIQERKQAFVKIAYGSDIDSGTPFKISNVNGKETISVGEIADAPVLTISDATNDKVAAYLKGGTLTPTGLLVSKNADGIRGRTAFVGSVEVKDGTVTAQHIFVSGNENQLPTGVAFHELLVEKLVGDLNNPRALRDERRTIVSNGENSLTVEYESYTESDVPDSGDGNDILNMPVIVGKEYTVGNSDGTSFVAETQGEKDCILCGKTPENVKVRMLSNDRIVPDGPAKLGFNTAEGKPALTYHKYGTDQVVFGSSGCNLEGFGCVISGSGRSSIDVKGDLDIVVDPNFKTRFETGKMEPTSGHIRIFAPVDEGKHGFSGLDSGVLEGKGSVRVFFGDRTLGRTATFFGVLERADLVLDKNGIASSSTLFRNGQHPVSVQGLRNGEEITTSYTFIGDSAVATVRFGHEEPVEVGKQSESAHVLNIIDVDTESFATVPPVGREITVKESTTAGLATPPSTVAQKTSTTEAVVQTPTTEIVASGLTGDSEFITGRNIRTYDFKQKDWVTKPLEECTAQCLVNSYIAAAMSDVGSRSPNSKKVLSVAANKAAKQGVNLWDLAKNSGTRNAQIHSVVTSGYDSTKHVPHNGRLLEVGTTFTSDITNSEFSVELHNGKPTIMVSRKGTGSLKVATKGDLDLIFRPDYARDNLKTKDGQPLTYHVPTAPSSTAKSTVESAAQQPPSTSQQIGTVPPLPERPPSTGTTEQAETEKPTAEAAVRAIATPARSIQPTPTSDAEFGLGQNTDTIAEPPTNTVAKKAAAKAPLTITIISAKQQPIVTPNSGSGLIVATPPSVTSNIPANPSVQGPPGISSEAEKRFKDLGVTPTPKSVSTPPPKNLLAGSDVADEKDEEAGNFAKEPKQD